MKKFYAILLLISLSCSSVYAGTVFLKYKSTGQPDYDNNFGSNAITLPKTNKKIIEKRRQRRLEDAYYQQFTNKHNVNININNNSESIETNEAATEDNTKVTPETQKADTEVKKESSSKQEAPKKSGPKTINGVTYYE